MPMQIRLIDYQHPDWIHVNAFLSEKFKAQFAATLQVFPLHYLVIYRNKKISACMGVTFPSRDAYYAEQYLDDSIENVISQTLDKKIERSDIIQLGSIASSSIYAAVEMIQLGPLYILCLGAKYAICTVTNKLSGLMQKLDINFHVIRQVTQCSLHQDKNDWGTYYEHKPIVGFVDCSSHKDILFNNTNRIMFNQLDIELLQYKKQRIRHVA